MSPRFTGISAICIIFFMAMPVQAVEDLYQKAVDLDQQGFFEDAAQAWKKALASNLDKGKKISAQIKLSQDLYRLNQFDTALSQAHELVKSEPDNFHANFNLGNLLSGLGRFAEAIAPYEKTVQLRPDEGLAYAGLALSHFGNGQTPSAITRLEEAKKIFQDKKNISWHRDANLMLQQIKMYEQAQYPPSFSNLWLKNNIKLVRETYEKNILQ